MTRLAFRAMFAYLALSSLWCCAQTDPVTQQSSSAKAEEPAATKSREAETTTVKEPATMRHLAPVGSIVPEDMASTFQGPFVCDQDGSLYLRYGSGSALRKLNSKGERVALFQPTSDSDVEVQIAGSYAISPDGEVYMLVFAKEISRYVFIFRSDGTFKNKIKLQPGFAFMPSSLVVFSNGNLLVTGQRLYADVNKPHLPFTGIFAADGRLLKQLNLEDDDAIRGLAQANDIKAGAFAVPNSNDNRAISAGQAKSARDGNAYIMRFLSPAVFYVVSPSGEVVRTFTVDSGNPAYWPMGGMQIDGNRIAVLFLQPETMEKIMKVVSLEGEEIASYDELRENGKPKLGMLGAAFACYSQRPERFTFLVPDDKRRVQLRSAEAR